jgi:hypothetical protein
MSMYGTWYIFNAYRLPQPEMATNDVYDCMLKCWEYNPQDRQASQLV